MPMPEQLSLAFVRLTELADAEGAVPEDGSGIDGIWTTTVCAPERDRDWNIAMNADTEDERVAEDFPSEGLSATLEPAQAVIHLGDWPVGVLSPYGGEVLVEDEYDPHAVEDELIDDVEQRIETLGGAST